MNETVQRCTYLTFEQRRWVYIFGQSTEQHVLFTFRHALHTHLPDLNSKLSRSLPSRSSVDARNTNRCHRDTKQQQCE